MIRRDIRLGDGAAGWLLISQVEHARVSAELASHCVGRFAAPSERTGPTPAPVRAEVLAAILHHDDGWAAWEQSPRLDLAHGRPLAFTEVDAGEAIAIWTRSIAAAEAVGPLAAWMVAGHFARLARRTDADRDAADLRTWKSQIDDQRRAWLAAWRLQDPRRHTVDLADEALQWLWTFDEVSLWLCCTCLANEPIPCAPEPYCAGRGTPIEMELLATEPGQATAEPWRFSIESLDIAIVGLFVPARQYQNPAALLAAGAAEALNWRISTGKKLLETPSKPRS